MKSMQHVLWRGALALGLMALGVASGIGMPPAATAALAERADCPSQAKVLVVQGGQMGMPGRVIATAFVVKREAGPANPES